MFVRNFILIIFTSLSTAGFFSYSVSQTFQRELNLIPVSDGEGLLNNIFSGGHNNIEHQFVDIDDDGDSDIFYLDSDRTFGWFENTGSPQEADYGFRLNSPAGLFFSDWFYFVDIDSDNDYDYFTGNVDRISLFRNDGTVSSPAFILAEDTVLDNEGQSIYSEFGSNPIFVDIDGDGDYDFISGNSAGTVTFYENIGTAQQFNLKFITNIWQNLVITGTSDGNPRHGASSLDFIDIDADDDLDLFWGDFFSNSLYFIENQGTATNPNMQVVSNVYPINPDSVNTSGFNMPRFTDIDADGDYDLFVSVLYDPTVPQSLLYFENHGTPLNAYHELVTQDYLKTLDVGNNSVPALIDIDDDDDFDLLLGSLNNPVGTIHFLENTGTSSNPAFFYLDSSFFNIENDLSTSPAFADLDDDSDYDLVVGRFDGKLDVYLNSGSPSSPQFTGAELLSDSNGEIIDIGTSAVPFLIDIDNDSDADLATGGFNGLFRMYLNTGSAQNYLFQLDTFYFATGTSFLDVGDNSTPYLIDYDKDGALDLFSGNRYGKFYFWKNEGSNLSPLWNLVTDQFLDERFGGNTSPFLIDIDNDSDLDIFFGNVKGGLYFYDNTEISIVAEREIKPVEDFTLSSYPNPFNPAINFILCTTTGVYLKLEIFNSIGEKVNSLFNGYIQSGTHKLRWDGRNDSGSILPSGIYFVVAQSKNLQQAIKISFLK